MFLDVIIEDPGRDGTDAELIETEVDSNRVIIADTYDIFIAFVFILFNSPRDAGREVEAGIGTTAIEMLRPFGRNETGFTIGAAEFFFKDLEIHK